MSRETRPALLPAAVAAWFGYLALDFLTHAVLLASWWRATEAYWLPPAELLRLVPLGYASFAIYCAALTWLLVRLYGARPGVGTGLRFGALAGVVFGLTTVLGGYSASRLPSSYFLVALPSITIESAAAGGLAAWVLATDRRWRRVALVFGLALLLFAVGVVAQNLFFPTPADHLK
jgi:hypothetical protein